MHSGDTLSPRKLWVIWASAGLIICAAVAAALLLTSSDRGSAGASSTEALYSVDVRNPRALVGSADDVFLGRVVKQSGQGYFWCSKPDSAPPYGLYRVEVLSGLKGELTGTIEICQPGGRMKNGEMDIMENDQPLKAGEVCLFVTNGVYDPTAVPTEHEPTAGRPTIVANTFGDVRIGSESERAAVMAQFRDAVTHQILPNDGAKASPTTE